MAKKKSKKVKTQPKDSDEKKNKLDWETFNFLENLLVFCVMKERNAPQESKGGVQFRINPKPDCQCLCLMFHIDRPQDPLIVGQGIKRPDYMTLFIENDTWICTIIEMKGATEKGFKHGVEQIKVLRDRIREELKVCASKVKLKFQAIMMIPYGSQIPGDIVKREFKQGLVILPLQYNNKAELFNYVSKINSLTEKYVHEEIRPYREDTNLENILIKNSLPKRIKDKFLTVNENIASNDEGIYINYDLPECEGYSALAIDNNGMRIGLKKVSPKDAENIQKSLMSIGLQTPQSFEIKTIED